jgi:hypothetical protein
MSPQEEDLLDLLAECHDRETGFLSSVTNKIQHPYYQVIIAWGIKRPSDIIPWLLNKLDTNWHWAWALSQIVVKEERPTFPEGSAGRGKIITQTWLTWGKEKGYL